LSAFPDSLFKALKLPCVIQEIHQVLHAVLGALIPHLLITAVCLLDLLPRLFDDFPIKCVHLPSPPPPKLLPAAKPLPVLCCGGRRQPGTPSVPPAAFLCPRNPDRDTGQKAPGFPPPRWKFFRKTNPPPGLESPGTFHKRGAEPSPSPPSPAPKPARPPAPADTAAVLPPAPEEGPPPHGPDCSASGKILVWDEAFRQITDGQAQ